MTRNIATGLDIGTSWIRIAVCEWKSGDPNPHVLALVRKPSRGLRRGYIVNLDEAIDCIREAVAEAERAAKVKIKRAFLGIGGVTLESKTAEGEVLVSRPDLEITMAEIRRAVETSERNLTDMQNRQILHRVPVSFKLDGKKVLGSPENMKGSKLEARTMFVTYSKLHLKDFVTVAEEAGLIVEDIIASPLAAGSVILSKIQRASGSVLANIGSQTTSIAVFEENIPLSVHVFPVGSTDITNDIALGFKIPLEDADRIKRREMDPDGPKRKLDEIIEARVSDVFEYIEIHLKKIGRSGLLPAGIVLTGGGASTINIDGMAKEYFRLPARLAAPSQIQGSQNQTIDPAWAVAYGLCVYDYEYELEGKETPKTSTNIKRTLVKWFKEFMP